MSQFQAYILQVMFYSASEKAAICESVSANSGTFNHSDEML